MSHTPGQPDIGYTTGYYNGQKDERERIIKLLEDNDHYSVDWLIELIKGETK